MSFSTFPELVSLNHQGLLAVTGVQSKQFLQGQLTCHLDEVYAEKSRLGAHCNPQGRVISFFRILSFAEGYLLQMPRSSIPIALQALKKYAVFYKQLHLEDISDHYQQWGYKGEQRDLFQSWPNGQSEIKTVGESSWLTKVGPQRYELICTAADFDRHFNDKSSLSNDTNGWLVDNILAGIPTIYPETSEKFLPHDLNLPELKAVSFNKGCYTGQEIIARMHYRGKLKKQLCSFTANIQIKPVRGSDLFQDGKACGNIVDFAPISYTNNAYAFLASLSEGTEIFQLSLDSERNNKLTAFNGA